MTPSTRQPPGAWSEHSDPGDEPEVRRAEEEAADFCLRALRAGDVASVLGDAAATAARVLGCELVRLVELRGDEEVVVAVSGGQERAQVFVEGGGSGIEVPIPGRVRPFGVLGAYSKTARGFPPAAVGFLQILATTSGHAVARLKGEEPPADAATDTTIDSVVHDLGNLLTIIAGNAELLLEGCDPDSPRPVEVEAIAAATRRAEALVPQLLALAPPSGTTPEGAPTRTAPPDDV